MNGIEAWFAGQAKLTNDRWLQPKLAATGPPSPETSTRQPRRPSSLSLRSSHAGHASPWLSWLAAPRAASGGH